MYKIHLISCYKNIRIHVSPVTEGGPPFVESTKQVTSSWNPVLDIQPVIHLHQSIYLKHARVFTLQYSLLLITLCKGYVNSVSVR